MQQKIFKGRAGFGAGLAVSLVAHLGLAVFFLLRLPTDQPKPEKEETVQVEMVPEPEKKPQEKPAPRPKPQEDIQPVEKPAEKAGEKPVAKAESQPVNKPAEKQPEAKKTEEKEVKAAPLPPQAFEAAVRDGDKEAGGDRPSEPEKKPDIEPRVDRALPPSGQETPQKPEPDLTRPQDKPVETPAVARLPELDLPESVDPTDVLNEGEAPIETVPTPQARPKDVPTDSQAVAVQELASAENQAPDARPNRPPSELTSATELYSADTLSDPRVRQALGKLPRERRIVQICMIETLEQVRHSRPDTVPQGLFFDPRNGSPISGLTMTAKGAAYKTAGGWIDVDFKCTVNDDVDNITAFSFAVGGSVPKSQWQARRFPKN